MRARDCERLLLDEARLLKGERALAEVLARQLGRDLFALNLGEFAPTPGPIWFLDSVLNRWDACGLPRPRRSELRQDFIFHRAEWEDDFRFVAFLDGFQEARCLASSTR